MKKILIILIFIVIIGGGAAFFFLAPGANRASHEVAAAPEERVIPVKVITASAGRLQNYIKLSGDVTASSTIDVMPDVSGRLSFISVKPGDYVVKNQVLAQVDPSRPGSTYALSPVKAPITGTVTKVIGSVGRTIAPSIPVLQIGQLDNLEIVTFVSERYISFIRKGELALVTARAIPGKVLKAYVAEISPVVNVRTRTMEVTLSLNGSSRYLKAGMLADLTLVLEDKENVVRIPEEAILTKADSVFVYIAAAGDIAEERVIRTGLQIDGYAEVLEGISHGERVILSGKALISEGTKLHIMETLPEIPAAGNLGS